MSALKAYARQQEWKRRMDEVMAQPRKTTGSNATLRALQRTLRDAGMLPTSETPPRPRYTPPPVPPSSPLNDLLSAATAAVAANLRRHLPASPEPVAGTAAVPASTPTPAPATSKPPAELVFGRDIDGRMTTAMVADQEFRFQRDREGRIESAVSDRHIIKYQRDHAGNIVGARRLESKE